MENSAVATGLENASFIPISKKRNAKDCSNYQTIALISHASKLMPPCPSLTPGVHSNSHPLSLLCHPAISSSVIPFSSFPQSLPASGSFPISQIFAWGGQSIGASAVASVLPMNTQDWPPLDGLVGSPCSPRDSQESSPTQQFKSIRLLHSPTLTSIHDLWKNHSLDKRDLSWQSNVSAFEYDI